jgi:hypothetical protein
MDPPSADLPAWQWPGLLHSVQDHHAAQQASEFYNLHAPPEFGLQAQTQDNHLIAGQSYLPHSVDPSPAHHIDLPHNAEALNDAPAPMGPPRKRKAPTLRAGAWEPYKARIIQLHNVQGLPLREVKEKIEQEFRFTAE